MDVGCAGQQDRRRRLQRLGPVRDVDGEAAGRRHAAGALTEDGDVVPPLHVQFRALEREHLGGDAELEGRQVLEGVHRDTMGSGGLHGVNVATVVA